jgi:phage FluMu protein Com
MVPSEPSQPSGSTPASPRAKCPQCGELNSYLPKFVVRSIRCAKCGHAFAPGFAQIKTDYVPPPQPPAAANVSAIVSLVLGLLSVCLAFRDVTVPAVAVKATVVLLLLASLLAIVFGIQGLIHSKSYQVHGHWASAIGIAMGSLGLLIMCSVLFG